MMSRLSTNLRWRWGIKELLACDRVLLLDNIPYGYWLDTLLDSALDLCCLLPCFGFALDLDL